MVILNVIIAGNSNINNFPKLGYLIISGNSMKLGYSIIKFMTKETLLLSQILESG